MKKEPNEDTIRLLEGTIFPLEVIDAFRVHSLLPDRWDGASGNYLGKDWSALGILLDKLNIINPKDVIYFLKIIDNLTMGAQNNKLERERRKAESVAKKATPGKKQGISVNG